MFVSKSYLCALLDVACRALLVISALVLVNCGATFLWDALTFVVIDCAALLLGENLKYMNDDADLFQSSQFLTWHSNLDRVSQVPTS